MVEGSWGLVNIDSKIMHIVSPKHCQKYDSFFKFTLLPFFKSTLLLSFSSFKKTSSLLFPIILLPVYFSRMNRASWCQAKATKNSPRSRLVKSLEMNRPPLTNLGTLLWVCTCHRSIVWAIFFLPPAMSLIHKCDPLLQKVPLDPSYMLLEWYDYHSDIKKQPF